MNNTFKAYPDDVFYILDNKTGEKERIGTWADFIAYVKALSGKVMSLHNAVKWFDNNYADEVGEGIELIWQYEPHVP